MLKLTINGTNYKIRFSTLVITDSDLITKILDGSAEQVKIASEAMMKRDMMLKEIDSAEKENREPNVNTDELKSIMTDVYKSVYNSAVNAMKLTAELLAAGLQKYHRDEFGYYIDDPDDPDGIPTVDERLKARAIRKCYELIDEYEDDATDEQRENHTHDSAELYAMLNQELERNGFLSRVSRSMNEETPKTKRPRKVPTDHMPRKPTKKQLEKATETES